MNKISEFYNFENLAKLFNITSRREFVRENLQKMSVKIHKKQELNASTKLKIALFICEIFKDEGARVLESYEVGQWHTKKLEFCLQNKDIYRQRSQDEKGEEKIKEVSCVEYEWFVFENFVGTSLELDFLEFIEQNKGFIDEHFKEWLIVRNERMSEFAIYDGREFLENGEPNEHYSDRFEPDFYFLGRRKGDEALISQCIIEPKGENLLEFDRWKEDFLKSLKEVAKQDTQEARLKNGLKSVAVSGLRFFKKKDKDEFKEVFNSFIKKD